MISSTKPDIFAWRLPRAGTCGVPEADVFFAAFDEMCQVLEQSADKIPADIREQIERACGDFVATKERMGISPFCIIDLKAHIDYIVEHKLDEFTEEEKNRLCDMGLLDYRYLFDQMVSVYDNKEIASEISYYRDSEVFYLIKLAEMKPEKVPDMALSDKIDDDVGWHLAAACLLNSLGTAFPDGNMPAPLFKAAAHLRDTAESMVFDTYGIYTRRRLAEHLSGLANISLIQAEERIKQWEKTGRIKRNDYRQVLHAWGGSSSHYASIIKKEDQAVCDAVCRVWHSAVHVGLMENSRTEPGDGLEI